MISKNDPQLNEELVSIVMPAYNCEEYIGEAIKSVAAQVYQNWELIIVDDDSNDKTVEVVHNFMDTDSRIKLYRLEKNSGAAIARNKAVEHAYGVYIAFLDSDDVWFPNKLVTQVDFMKKNGYSFTCTEYSKIDENGEELNIKIDTKPVFNYEGLLRRCPGNSTVIYNSSELGKFKGPEILKRNDYAMWLQVIKKAKYLYGLEKKLSSHRIRNNGLSSQKTGLVKYHWKVYREIEHLSLFNSIYLIIFWVFVTVFKLR